MQNTVFFYECPAHIPFCFALHSYVVIQEWEILTRYEVLWEKDEKHNTHIYINAFGTHQWINIFPFIKNRFFWTAKLRWYVQWQDAERIITIIKKSIDTYPYKNTYNVLWPNSNTYIEWIREHIVNCPFELSWNAFGKNYKNLKS